MRQFRAVIARILLLAMLLAIPMQTVTVYAEEMEDEPSAAEKMTAEVPEQDVIEEDTALEVTVIEEENLPDAETEEPAEKWGGTDAAWEGLTLAAEPTLDAEEVFSCLAVDSLGRTYLNYPVGDTLYLFIPSTVDVKSLTLHYTGTVRESSAGTVDAEKMTIASAFAVSNTVTLTNAQEHTYTVQLMQSELPAVYITLNNAQLSDVHQNKSVKFKKNTVEILDPAGDQNLKVEDAVELKGRGNSTWRLYEKKGYQIKFKNATSVLGMGAAKKWVLLANAGDDSMMRTQLVYRMAEKLDMDFVPSFQYTDLWINGEYRGTYILGEKVEIGDSRLNLQASTGALFEHDEAFYAEEEHWFYSKMLQRHFVLKEIVDESEESVASAMTDFQQALDTFVEFLYSTPSQKVALEDLGKWIDVDSFVKYYLINEYALNCESFATSFYWYKDGPEDVIHLGPIWDFDTCMGNDSQPSTASYGENHILFQYLLSIPAFYERTMELLERYRPALQSMTMDAATLKNWIGTSADMNYLRWDVLGKPNPKNGSASFAETYELAVDHLQSWLRSRESNFRVVKRGSVTSAVGVDCKKMMLNFYDGNTYNSMRFGVWSLENGQDDLLWYQGKLNDNGEWVATVDLTKHATVGMYRIVARPNGGSNSVGSGYNYVSSLAESDFKTTTVVSEDCTTINISLADNGLCSNVSFAVWSETNGQDDLRWYNATFDGECWQYQVDLKRHNSAGSYFIHVYGTVDGTRSMLDAVTAYVQNAVSGPEVNATVSEDGKFLKIQLENAGDYAKIWAPTWSVQGGQDDINWYEMHRTSENCWEAVAPLQNHGTAGDYLIHFYGGNERPQDLLADHKIFVKSVPRKRLTAAVDQQCDTLSLSIENVDKWKELWVAVWSEKDGQDDLKWYRPLSRGNGKYTCEVDLREHMTVGTYHIHLYGGDGQPEDLVDYTMLYVASLPKTQPILAVEVTDTTLEVTLSNCANLENIWIPVWSEQNGQDDLYWYRPEKQADGTWRTVVNLTVHGTLGRYAIHAYTGEQSPTELIAYTGVTVGAITKQPLLKTAVVDAKRTITVQLLNAEEKDKIWIPVWAAEDARDLHWYLAKKNQDGVWSCTIPMSNHPATGVYHIHAYSGMKEPEQLVAYTDVLL